MSTRTEGFLDLDKILLMTFTYTFHILIVFSVNTVLLFSVVSQFRECPVYVKVPCLSSTIPMATLDWVPTVCLHMFSSTDDESHQLSCQCFYHCIMFTVITELTNGLKKVSYS